uniref:Mug135-like C-terminal domain-containing protein n=1 Tax=Mycena chlorophos TaxID=658473 RepID=A0ABQ0LAD6_MYCCL|nr:predicted protein [Mycena chlorophos]
MLPLPPLNNPLTADDVYAAEQLAHLSVSNSSSTCHPSHHREEGGNCSKQSLIDLRLYTNEVLGLVAANAAQPNMLVGAPAWAQQMQQQLMQQIQQQQKQQQQLTRDIRQEFRQLHNRLDAINLKLLRVGNRIAVGGGPGVSLEILDIFDHALETTVNPANLSTGALPLITSCEVLLGLTPQQLQSYLDGYNLQSTQIHAQDLELLQRHLGVL